MTIAGAVLGAGGGSRFEGPQHKLLAEFRGRPVASWAIESALIAGFNDTYVISGAVDLQAELAEDIAAHMGDKADRITWLHSPSWDQGQSLSLAVVIDQARRDGHDAIVIGLADQPMVPASAWRSVGAARGVIAIADFDGDRCPPVKLEKSVWDQLPREGDLGARELIRSNPELVSPVRCAGKAADIDTKRDLKRWS